MNIIKITTKTQDGINLKKELSELENDFETNYNYFIETLKLNQLQVHMLDFMIDQTIKIEKVRTVCPP